MKEMELCCRTNGTCHCVSITYYLKDGTIRPDHTVMSRGCHWLCDVHGPKYEQSVSSRVSKRLWVFGRLQGDATGYIPRPGTVPDLFMKRIELLGPLVGICTGADKQPAINLKKAGFVYTTKQGYALTRKGRRYIKK